MVNLHLATETPDRPLPAFERPWFVLLTFIAGFALGLAVMWVTDFEPVAVPPSPFEMVVRP